MVARIFALRTTGIGLWLAGVVASTTAVTASSRGGARRGYTVLELANCVFQRMPSGERPAMSGRAAEKCLALPRTGQNRLCTREGSESAFTVCPLSQPSTHTTLGRGRNHDGNSGNNRARAQEHAAECVRSHSTRRSSR